MKVLIIKGSPNTNGTSNTIVNEFIKGAKEAHHEIYHLYLINLLYLR